MDVKVTGRHPAGGGVRQQVTGGGFGAAIGHYIISDRPLSEDEWIEHAPSSSRRRPRAASR